MSQRKKNINQQQQQRHLAQQYRIDFFKRMQEIIENECGLKILDTIPLDVLDRVYKFRFLPFRFTAAYGETIPSKDIERIKKVFSCISKNKDFRLEKSDTKISITELFTIMRTIFVLKTVVNTISFPRDRTVRDALDLFFSELKIDPAGDIYVYNTLLAPPLFYNNISETTYWLSYECPSPHLLEKESDNIMFVHSVKPEKRQVKTEDGTRPAFRVGWAIPINGADWIKLEPSKLGYTNLSDDSPLDVYIQQHALDRLMERIDCFNQGIIFYNMYLSLVLPHIAYDNFNRLQIKLRFNETKAGYFRADIIDGIILLRTFLFVTNNGTPEGVMLEKKTGLKKLDKKYLSIDKLSTFMDSDLGTNEEVRQLFMDSGCECLIELYDTAHMLVFEHKKDYDFNFMLSYLNKKDSHASMLIPEPYMLAEQ